jgi:hypothetical protein
VLVDRLAMLLWDIHSTYLKMLDMRTKVIMAKDRGKLRGHSQERPAYNWGRVANLLDTRNVKSRRGGKHNAPVSEGKTYAWYQAPC